MWWPGFLQCLFMSMMATSCISLLNTKEVFDSTDATNAKAELRTRYFLDYKNEKHFNEVVVSANVSAFVLFLKAYSGMPCAHVKDIKDVLLSRNVDEWCYDDDSHESDLKRMDWFVAQLARPDYPKDKREVMVRAMVPYEIHRRLVIKLLNSIRPSFLQNDQDLLGNLVAPSSDCRTLEIKHIIELEINSRPNPDIFSFGIKKYKPCVYEKEYSEPVYLSAVGMCPENISIIATSCPEKVESALGGLQNLFHNARRKNPKNIHHWMTDIKAKDRFVATLKALQSGLETHCEAAKRDNCKAEPNYVKTIMDSYNVLEGRVTERVVGH